MNELSVYLFQTVFEVRQRFISVVITDRSAFFCARPTVKAEKFGKAKLKERQGERVVREGDKCREGRRGECECEHPSALARD